MSKRATHYVSYGGGCSLVCYRREMGAYLNGGGKSPTPLRTTNILDVTCPECAQTIADLMARKLATVTP